MNVSLVKLVYVLSKTMHVLQEITSMDAETLKECKSIASASLDLPIFSHHGCVPLYPEPFSVEDVIGCDEIQQY